MAFRSLADSRGVKARAPQAQTGEVFVALYNTGKTDDSLTVSIRVGGRVMNKLGWRRGDFVDVGEGIGEDAGVVQIEKVEGTGRRLTDPSGLRNDPDAARLYILTKAFDAYEFSDTSQPGESVEYQAFKGKLTLQLPKWARPKTTAAQEIDSAKDDEGASTPVVGGPSRTTHKRGRSAVS